jgi:hypothetical protein
VANEPTFVTIGSPTDKINVHLSYRIVELFSEGLYASPNEAVEELVANSFDARNCKVCRRMARYDRQWEPAI